jgi:hypothetical protein
LDNGSAAAAALQKNIAPMMMCRLTVRMMAEIAAFTGRLSVVVPALGPGLHALAAVTSQGVEGRDKPGHDGNLFAARPGMTKERDVC